MLEIDTTTNGGNSQKVATVATPPEYVMVELVDANLNSSIIFADCAQIMLHGEPEIELIWSVHSKFLPSKPEDWLHLEPYGDNMRLTLPLNLIGAVRLNCTPLDAPED